MGEHQFFCGALHTRGCTLPPCSAADTGGVRCARLPTCRRRRRSGYWQRYIYLWMRYALWEELEGQDAGRTREVYRACLGLILHASFTFAKVGCMCCACHPAQTLSAGVCDYLNQH